jgi:hypothetical protein
MQKLILSIVGLALAFVGIIWFFQGIGLIKGSFMTNNLLWAIIGPLAVIAGVALLWYSNRRKPA